MRGISSTGMPLIANKNHMEKKKMFLPDRPIAFNRDFVSIGCGIKGALMLSQAVYWGKRTTAKDGSFYKTQAEWEEETGLKGSEYSLRAFWNLTKASGAASLKARRVPIGSCSHSSHVRGSGV